MRIEVDNNKLKNICDIYGLDINKALYYTNVVVIPGRDNLYITLDKDCNVIDVREYDDRFGGKYNYFEGIYTIFNDDIITGIRLDNEFGSLDSLLSLGTIVKLTDKYSPEFNGKSEELSEDQKNLISYLAFLRKVMDRFFILSYQMKSYRFICPDIDTYIKTLIADLNKFVDGCLSFNLRPDEFAFIDMSGQKSAFIGYTNLLSDAMNLLVKCKGYKPMPNNGIEVEPLNENDESVSFEELLNQMRKMNNDEKNDNKTLEKKR